MNNINPFLLSKYMLRLKPKDLYNWLVVGHDDLVDEYFWKKFCVRRGIVFGPLPWERRAELWMHKKPVWTQIDDTPWDSSSQCPKYIWGLPEASIIEYRQSETADMISLTDLNDVIIASLEGGLFSTKSTGYYQTIKEGEVVYFIRHCPYDKMQIGFYNGQLTIDESTHYWGSTKSGLRQGHGILLFDTGFTIKKDWYDYSLVSLHQREDYDIPAMSISMIETLEGLLNSYIKWCNVVGYISKL